MADIDELKFSIILDDNKFTKRMEEVNALAGKFEQSVKSALAVTNLLDAAQGKGAKNAQQKAQSAEKAAAAAKKEAEATGKLEGEEEKVYKLVELRQKRREQSGQLTKDEVQVLKQMESIEKALLNVREQHKGKLAEEFSIMMNEEGMTRQQVGSYQSLVTQMQAATSETAKREAAEKAALALREQKENAILALKRTLAGVDQEILSEETKIAVQKGLSGELTAKEIANLQTVIATESRRHAAQRKADAEKQAKDRALIGLRQTLVGVDQKILSIETQQKIAKAEAGQLTSKEISQLNAQIALERRKASEQERQRAAAARLSSELTRQTSLMRGLTSYVAQYASVFGAATFLRNLVRITGEFEAQRTALRAILQDTPAADNIYNQLQVLAVKSPYTFQNLVSYAKQLTAFSIPVNEVYETTKKLADVSAGLGVDMGRIILAYGQVRSAEFLRGQEVRQFTEAGIPILAELAKQFAEMEGHAISVGEVFNRISARQVPFEMVEEAFNRMTSAGGKFYNMQEVLAETVKGKVANLRDAWEIMLSKIGDENGGTIKGIVTTMTNLFANYEKWIGYVSAIVKGLGFYAAALAVLNGLTKASNAYQAIRNSIQMISNAQLKLSAILLPTNNALQKAAIANNMQEAATLAALNTARKAALGILGVLVGVIALVVQRQRSLRDESLATSRAMDELTRSYRENISLFAVGWNDVEKAYKKVADERHNAYKRALEENKGLLPDISESSKKLIEDSAKLVAPVGTIRRKIEEVSIYGGELEVALCTASESVKQLVSDGGELEAAIISVSKETKQLVSDGGELDAAVVVADRGIKQLVSDGGELEAAIVTASGKVKQLVSDGGELEAAMVVADARVKQLVSDGGELDAAVITAEKKIGQLVSDGGELEAAMISIDRKTKQLVSDGGELAAAVVSVSRCTKQLVADGGELEPALVTADAKVKQLVSDGGELEAAIVTASGVLPKLNSALVDTAHSLKEVGLAGEPVKRSQVDIEKQFSASEKTVKDYKDALDDLYKKFPNFIDENVRQKIAVEDLAGAWDIATQNMKQYYAENALHQSHEILTKGYKEDTNKIIEDLNARLRAGREFKQYRQNGLINEGSIQLLDAYVMGLKTEEELTEDLRRLIYLLNSAGGMVTTSAEGDFKGPATLNTAGNLIDVARAQYLARTRAFNKAVEESDDAIERDFTSTRHRQVREYLLNNGVAEDSDLMMRNGAGEFESWQSWQVRMREEYANTGEENQKVIKKMFDHFGLVVSADGLSPVQSKVSEWIMKNPAPSGVSIADFKIKPETDIAEFAENALKKMQDDAKALARLPKEFQKTEDQTWDEYAEMLEDKGETTKAAVARRVQYFEKMSQEIWEDDVFGSSKELIKKENASKKNWEEFRRDKIADLKQRFQDLKELKSAYDQFKGIGFNDKQIGGLLTNYFGVGIPDGGFGNAFESLAKEMDKYSANDAKDIRNYVAGKDWKENAKSIEEARKATDKFAKSLAEFQAVTKRLGLDGFAAEIDKILVETNAKNQKLSLEWSQKEEELEAAKDGWIAQYRVRNENATIEQAQKAWEDYYKAQKDAAKESVDAQIAYNNKLAQMSVDGKADEWVGTMLKREDISLSDWSDKTPEQIDVIKEKLIALRDNLSELIPEQLKTDAESVNVTFEELLKTIEKIINNKIDTTDVEKAKKSLEQMAKGMQKISSYLGSLGESVSSLGGSWESLGGSISSAGNYLSSYADITQKVKSGQMTQNAANISAYMMIGQYLISSTAEIVANFKELREATEAWEMQLQQAGYKLTNLQLDALSYEQAGVFGVENPYSKALAASEQLRVSQSKLLELTESISKIKVKVDEKTVVDGMKVAGSAIEGAALGAAAGSIIPGIGTAIGAAAGAVLGVVKGIFAGRKKKDIETTLGSLTGGLIFDPETLDLTDEVLSKYEQMDEAGKALVDHWEEIKETMKEAIETFNENIKDVVGDMAADVKDMLIAAFNDGDVYGAVDDLHDYIGGKIQDLLIEIAYSTALQPLFDELEKNMRHSFGLDENGNPLEKIDDEVDYDWTDDLADFNSKLDSSLVLVKKAFDSAKKELEGGGYSWNTGDDEDSDGGTLASGIKSITEDTANLLASYVNAIRADVSYGRLQWERVAVAVEGQANQYVTLNDYLSQVQSNTYNTAQRCNDILVELRGIITTEDGSPSVRTSPQ